MQLVTYGINHNTAPVHIREHIAFNADALPAALASLKQSPAVVEAVIISTCNRTEIYCHIADDFDDNISEWLHQFHQQEAGSLDEYIYSYQDHDEEVPVQSYFS